MTAAEFRDWQDAMKRTRNRKITQQEFAAMLGVSRRTICEFQDNGPKTYAKTIRLACKALYHNLGEDE